jgi:hypothetical protein
MTDRLSFDPDQFVNRERALEVVMEKVRRLARGLPVERQVVNFHGSRGSGKTWLLRELERQIDELGIAVSYLDLQSIWEEGERSVGVAMEAVLTEFRKVRRLRDKQTCLKNILQDLTKGPLVLLIDEVNAPDGAFLDELLERVLAPLVRENDILIVLAERGQSLYWPVPEFREKFEEFDLEPFAPDDTKRQIKLQISNAEDESDIVVSRTGGYPWANYILASHLPDEKGGLERCAELFLQDVKKELRPYFKTLSILQAFDETRMELILPVYPPFADQTWDYAARRDKRKALVNTTLARWWEEARGYVLDEPLRIVLEALLRKEDPDLWKQLHCAAYRMYMDWAEKYEQSKDWWTKEAQYHADELKGADHDPGDCP